ncbi:MAG: DNA repair protein RecN [Alphaproteobacteria bacterium]|nr:DNA repair protein RecN [Alphaproteobacteria bacterium]
MLTSIFIKNIVLINELHIDFKTGLNVLTGETGAGKSILLDSLGLSLGYRSDVGLIRHGQDKAMVVSSFDLEKNHPVFKILSEQDIETEDSELILKRTISADGKSKGYINGMPVPINFMRKVGNELVEIHGQFETQGLLNVKNHINVLDSFAGTDKDKKEVASLYYKLKDLKSKLADLEMQAENSARDEEYYAFAYQEIDKVDPQPNEEQEISELRYKLLNQGKIIDALKEVRENLTDYQGAESKLSSAIVAIDKVADKAGEEINPLTNALDGAMAEMQNSIIELQEYMNKTSEISLSSLEEVEERFFLLKGLARKYKCSVDDLVKVKDDFKAKLDLIENIDEEIRKVKSNIKEAKVNYLSKAEALSLERKKYGENLTNFVMKELPELKLEKARFKVAIKSKDISSDGIDNVEFKIATNPKSPLGDLNKIASGGELARFMLAIKVIVAKNASLPVMIFDEVDSGVGGATADAVGKKLFSLSKHLQLLVITHSAQVAARAHNHLKVQKAMIGEDLLTNIKIIDDNHRVDEIARMISGEEITEEGVKLAEKLLS